MQLNSLNHRLGVLMTHAPLAVAVLDGMLNSTRITQPASKVGGLRHQHTEPVISVINTPGSRVGGLLRGGVHGSLAPRPALGGLPPFHPKSTCLTQLILGP